MSTPILDRLEKDRIAHMMRQMQPCERRILAMGKRVSHVSGRVLSIPDDYDFSQLRGDESPLSFVDTVLALIEDDRFIGLDCTAQHYLNKAWENAKVLSRIQEDMGEKSCLNVGGGSCLINAYLASKGMRVVSVDNCERYSDLVGNENDVAASLMLDLTSISADFLDWESDGRFDYVFSICVIEHLPTRELQARFLRQMARYTRLGGVLLLTFGYGPKATTNPYVDERDVIRHIYSQLEGFDILDPFEFSGTWTISEGHTWGYLAARKTSD